VRDSDASLVVDAQGNCADMLNMFSFNDLKLRLVFNTEGCSAEGYLPCAAEPLEPGEIPGGDDCGDSVDDWAMVGCFDEM
jgi:hypothetical protein